MLNFNLRFLVWISPFSKNSFNFHLNADIPFLNDKQTMSGMNLDPEFLLHVGVGQGGGMVKGLFRIIMAQNSGDTVLREYFEEVKQMYERNSRCQEPTFISRNFVKKALEAIHDYVLNKIVQIISNECRPIYSVQVDTSTHVTITTQCALVIRYATQDLRVFNRIISLSSTDSSSGRYLFNKIKDRITELGLDMSDMIGSSTDGASSMLSENVGVTGLLQKHNEQHISIWCVCHRFNLVMQGALQKNNSVVSRIFEHLHSTASILRASPKRMKIWIESISELRVGHQPTNATRACRRHKMVVPIQSIEFFLLKMNPATSLTY